MLVCWTCRNNTHFTQVSPRGDAREIEQTIHGLARKPWAGIDDREDGVYCSQCREPVEADLSELDLVDVRTNFVAPLDFNADDLAEELRSLRPDADWTMLELPAQEARFADVPDGLAVPLIDALRRVGRERLYSHQADAIASGLAGRNTVLATPAGSGKSLGLLLPVLQRLSTDPTATAIVVYPLKALANDQMNALARLGVVDDPWTSTSTFELDLGDGTAPITVGRYDGATPDHERRRIRASGRLIVTNPDMLHQGVLPWARSEERPDIGWARVVRNLRFVVLDEIHTYQGVFGSAVSLVLRRLRRIAATFDQSPTFLMASATIGNALSHAEMLAGVDGFHLVDADGAGRRRRLVLICNPPERKLASTASSDADEQTPDTVGRIAPQTVALDLVTQGALTSDRHDAIRTIGFVSSRGGVFQLAQRIKNRLREVRRLDLVDSVAPYAATFLADDRVEAEGKLRDGTTLAIISTNALELGIDIPDLSLAVLVGYPGQVSSFRQRAGRVGRLGEGLAVLIVGNDPLQQFIARDPEALRRLLDGHPEDVIINPFASELAIRFGLRPAVADLGGLAFEDTEFFGAELVEQYLSPATGAPSRTLAGRSYWKVGEEPATPVAVGLRSAAASDSYTVMRQDRRAFEPVGVIDAASAPRDAFVPAVWNGPNGDTYVVTGFDDRKKEIYCEGPREVPFVTRGISIDRVQPEGEQSGSRPIGPALLGYGPLRTMRHVVAYRELYHSGAEQNRQPERGWPPVTFSTDGLYLDVPEILYAGHDRDRTMRALEHVLLSVAPAVVAIDPYDLEGSSSGSRLYLYDSFGGGIRLSRVAYDRFDEIVALAHDIVATCPCSAGCPSCVMLSRRPDGNSELSKPGAETVLSALITAATAIGEENLAWN
jgi:DEAD/DEAH box helicase domain-containing protein